MSNWDVKSVAVVLTLTKKSGPGHLVLCSHLWLWQASNH